MEVASGLPFGRTEQGRRPAMRRSEAGGKAKWITLAAMLLLAAAEAAAQESDRARRPKQISQEPRPERCIVVSLPDRKLALVENGEVVRVYPIAVAAPGNPSPRGEFRITHPTYYTPGKVVPPGRENPLGTRWLGLTVKGFGIHGTNEPHSIGRRASHGCIRMRNADIEELFERVRSGDAVELHAERSAALARVFGAPTPRSAPAAAAPAPVVVASVAGP
jgi:lipoprotein-anchoring transpeptidase ErfK/SrfK